MAISPTNTMQNHRGVYAEFTGDGSSTVLTIPLTSHYAGRSSQTGVPTVITGPSNFAHKAGKGGFYFPVDGTSVAVSSAVISGSNAVITNDRRGRQPNEGLRGFHFRPVERARLKLTGPPGSNRWPFYNRPFLGDEQYHHAASAIRRL